MTTTKAPELWASNVGRVVCPEHGGGYFTAYHRAHPRTRRFVTPLDAWERLTDAEALEWIEEYGKPGCESCPKESPPAPFDLDDPRVESSGGRAEAVEFLQERGNTL